MAGQVRNLKQKGGRFYARVSVPAHLRKTIGKTELITALGGDRRAAMKALPRDVALLQRQIDSAERTVAGNRLDNLRSPITTHDYGRAVWGRYQAILEVDEATRSLHPSQGAIDLARDRLVTRIRSGTVSPDPLEILDASLDFLRQQDAQAIDSGIRAAKLDALRRHLVANETHLVEHELDDFLFGNDLTAPRGSAERAVLIAVFVLRMQRMTPFRSTRP